MKSLSEIDTTAKRASRAAGYSWGISEEVGKNIKLLEFFACLKIGFKSTAKNVKTKIVPIISPKKNL